MLSNRPSRNSVITAKTIIFQMYRARSRCSRNDIVSGRSAKQTRGKYCTIKIIATGVGLSCFIASKTIERRSRLAVGRTTDKRQRHYSIIVYSVLRAINIRTRYRYATARVSSIIVRHVGRAKYRARLSRDDYRDGRSYRWRQESWRTPGIKIILENNTRKSHLYTRVRIFDRALREFRTV